MAAGATASGLRETRTGARALPKAVTEALRKVARDTALRVKRGARERVRKDTRITEQSIDVYPRVEEKAYHVGVFASPPHVRRTARSTRTAFLPNLPIWIEFGTQRMPARPFLLPAAQAEDAQYKRDALEAVRTAAEEALT